MDFACDRCHTEFQIMDQKLADKSRKVRCRRCGHMISIATSNQKSPLTREPPSSSSEETLLFRQSAREPSPVVTHAVENREWFVSIHETPVGLLTLSEVRDHLMAGNLSGDSLVWRQGMRDWGPMRHVPALFRHIRLPPALPSSRAFAQPEATSSSVDQREHPLPPRSHHSFNPSELSPSPLPPIASTRQSRHPVSPPPSSRAPKPSVRPSYPLVSPPPAPKPSARPSHPLVSPPPVPHPLRTRPSFLSRSPSPPTDFQNDDALDATSQLNLAEVNLVRRGGRSEKEMEERGSNQRPFDPQKDHDWNHAYEVTKLSRTYSPRSAPAVGGEAKRAISNNERDERTSSIQVDRDQRPFRHPQSHFVQQDRSSDVSSLGAEAAGFHEFFSVGSQKRANPPPDAEADEKGVARDPFSIAPSALKGEMSAASLNRIKMNKDLPAEFAAEFSAFQYTNGSSSSATLESLPSPLPSPSPPAAAAPRTGRLGSPKEVSPTSSKNVVEPKKKATPWIPIAMVCAATSFGITAAVILFQPPKEKVVYQPYRSEPERQNTQSSPLPPERPSSPETISSSPSAESLKTPPLPLANAAPTKLSAVDKNVEPLLPSGSKQKETKVEKEPVAVAPQPQALLKDLGPRDPGGPSNFGSGSYGSGVLSPEDVQRVVASKQSGIRHKCIEQTGGLAGSVSVNANITVAPGGRVQQVTASGNDPIAAKCIENSIRTWQFPPPGAETVVQIPFKFIKQ